MSTNENRNWGRIRYVEPTNLNSNKYGKVSDAISFPYEDYNMAIDLEINIADRFSCGYPISTNKMRKYLFSSDKGTLSFLGGTKYDNNNSYLTTNFTDISMTNPAENTSECLGIESISITYNSWMFPDVNIKFVDVRGASVMLPNENLYYNNGDRGSSSALYRSLFQFPYPVFILKVKGFYGKGVTYKLSCYKTDMELNAETGNFNITASFIGYMFGIYTDIPMTLLATAPYTEVGSKYWKDKIDTGTFKFYGLNGNYEQSSMMTIPELRLALHKVVNNFAYTSAAEEGKTVQDNLDEKISKLEALKSSFPFHGFNETGAYMYTITNQKPDNAIINVYINNFKAYYEQLKSFDSTYNTSYSNLFGTLNNENSVAWRYYEFSEKGTKYETATQGQGTVFTSLNGDANAAKKISQMISQKNNFAIIAIYKGDNNPNYLDFIPKLNKAIEDANTTKKAKEKEYKEKLDSIVEEELGFRPSIRNIFNLIFAHMDTFMHSIYNECLNPISKEMENSSIRAKSTYGVTGRDDTDTEYATDKESNSMVKSRADKLPPFAAFYSQEGYEQVKKELMWPGDLPNGENLREVNFIEDLIYGAQIFAERAQAAEDEIEQMTKNNKVDKKSNTVNNSDSSPNTYVTNFIPLTTYDIVNDSSENNPYTDIADMVIEGNEDFEDNVIGKFALRAFYNFMCNGYGSNNADVVGTIEAINFYKAVGFHLSSNFLRFIQNYADDKNTDNEIDNFISKITSSSSTWTFDGSTTKNSLFTISKDKLVYNLCKYLPIGEFNFTNMKKDMANLSELRKNEKYLYLDDDTDVIDFYHNDDDISTFKDIQNNAGYLTTLCDNIKSELNEAKAEIESEKEDKNIGDKKAYDVDNIYGIILQYQNENNNRIYELIYKGNPIYYRTEDNDFEELRNLEITRILNGSSDRKIDNCYIKYPSYVDGNKETSIFSTKLFKAQSTSDNVGTYAEAYLFLQSLPINNLDYKSANGVEIKSRLLREGAIYWRRSKNGSINSKGTDIKVWPNKDKKSFLGKEYGVTITAKDQDDYLDITEPKGSTSSRERYLINYFKEWARTKYSHIRQLIMYHKLYTNNTYSEGLNLDLLKDKSQGASLLSSQAFEVQDFLKDLYLGVDTVFDYYHTSKDGNRAVDFTHVSKKLMANAFESFMDQLHNIYGDTIDELNNSNVSTTAKIATNEANDRINNKHVKLSAYSTIKSLYDKWLCSTCIDKDPIYRWEFNPKDVGRNKGGQSYSDFSNFIYIDTFYHDIGYNLTVDIGKVSTWLSSILPTSNVGTTSNEMANEGKSVYDFLAQVSQDCGGMLLTIPQKFGVQNASEMADIFTPRSMNDQWDEDTSSFVFIYTYKPSEHLGNFVDNGFNLDMNGWSQYGDSFDLTADELIGSVTDSSGELIPAFGVTFAKQNQSIFKGLKLDTQSLGTTEASIDATINIAAKSTEMRDPIIPGQDIYKVYNQYAFNCTVECMGNLRITPLMIFQLNNVPMWKGAYIITKVNHEINSGNINTTFTGVRISRFAIPLSDSAMIVEKITGNELANNNTDGEALSSSYVGVIKDVTDGTLESSNNKSASSKAEKLRAIFGTSDRKQITEEAVKANLTTVEFKGREINGTTKNLKVEVHKSVSDVIKAILDEIYTSTNYNIYYIGGWRAGNKDGSETNHRLGLAVDINACSAHCNSKYKNQNPWFKDSTTSIGDSKGFGTDTNTEIRTFNHDVVKVFAKHGWGWGGSYGDTMHFSYLGGS